MLIVVDPHSGVPVYRQLMDQIKFHIASGLLRPGDELPSTRALSSELGVNPMTISKAYGFLVEEGLVERRRGVGLFVTQLHAGSRRRMQQTMLREAFGKAASLAVQMGVDEKEASRLFTEHLRRLRSPRKGRGNDEPR